MSSRKKLPPVTRRQRELIDWLEEHGPATLQFDSLVGRDGQKFPIAEVWITRYATLKVISCHVGHSLIFGIARYYYDVPD